MRSKPCMQGLIKGKWGHCIVTVQLSDEEQAAHYEGADYFLLFAGSTQRHLTSTLRNSDGTLQALCPAHDCCEAVLVTLCSATRNTSEAPEDPKSWSGRVAPMAEHRFSFVQDLAFDMAQFLVSTAGRADGLDGALLLDECQIPLEECERLDESLALALHHLVLPPGWSLLGSKRSNSTELSPHETLMHFSARRGLSRVTRFLLRQPGAREVLELVNKEGDTPSAVAASRGHQHIQELLSKAETDAETGKGTESVHRISGDARVFCHLPTLNTHTLTVNVQPGCEAPTLQKSVEQLLYLISHLGATGVCVLDLQLDSLHAAAECCDGVKTDLTCQENLQQPTLAPECLDTTTTEECRGENNKAESSGTVVCELCETGISEKDRSLPSSAPTSDLRPQESDLSPPEDWVCPSSNAEGDWCQTEQEGRVFSSQSLNLCDKSERAEGEAEGENVTVGILAAEGCDKQAEETDREAAIREEQEAKKGEEQEAGDGTAKRREEETSTESTLLITTSEDTKTSVMGLYPSSGSSEVSNTSDLEMKGEDLEKEELNQRFSDGLDGVEVEKDGLTDPGTTLKDVSNPSLIDCDDVIEEYESSVPCLLIEGLCEGEPPPDINSPEQNQETAGRDYVAEQQWSLASEAACHSGNCAEAVSSKELDGEELPKPLYFQSRGSPLHEPQDLDFRTTGSATKTQSDLVNSELSPDKMLTKRKTDYESAMAHGLSSDEDSFVSFRSSSTEIFNPTQDNGALDDGDLLRTNVEEPFLDEHGSENPESLKSAESNKLSLCVDGGLLLEPGPVSELTPSDCSKDGTDPESHLSSSCKTVEALHPEAVEEQALELPDDLSILSVFSTNKDILTEDKSNIGKSNSSALIIGIENSSSELSTEILSKSGLSTAEGWIVTGLFKDDQQIDPSEKSEKSGNEQFVLEQPKLEDSERTSNEGPAENHLSVPLSQDSNATSSITNVSSLEVEPPVLETGASLDHHIEDQVEEDLKTGDAVDGSMESCSSVDHEEDVFNSEDTIIDAGEEENVPAEGPDFSKIHRDGEASFHQPCGAQHLGSSTASEFPSLPSKSSHSTSCPSSAHRDSGSDIDSFLNAEQGFDSVFRKTDEPVTGGDSASEVSVSCSSTDDTASVGPSSSSPEGSQGLGCSWSPEESIQTGVAATAGLDRGGSGGGGAADAEEEAKDRVTEVPQRSCIFQHSIRSLSPLRRHSWGPGKNNGGEAEMNQRSSTRSPVERKPAFHRRSYSLEGLSRVQEELRGSIIQGPHVQEPWRMPRHDSDDRVSLVSLTEEQDEREEQNRLHDPKLRRYRPLRNSCPSMTLPLTKSVSMVAISHKDIDAVGRLRRRRRISFSFNLSPILTKSKSQFVYGDTSSSDDEDDSSTRSFSSNSGSVAYSISEEEPGPLRSDTEGKNVTKVSRTFSYLKSKMSKKTREKEREKKDKDKEVKEKDKKIVNGHLFTPVASNQAAQCFQCNKSLTSKDVVFCTLLDLYLIKDKWVLSKSDEDYSDLTEAVRLVKEVIAAVDSKVNEHEKRCRLKEFHSRMDSKSIMMLKSGQIFAREDLLRRKLIHDGPLQLKNSQGKLKDVHALMLSDVLVFLQEKEQKYVFAMLDQRSTVLSLQKLIVREVANKERGLFLITAGTEKPEMMEVLVSSKEERNTWIQLIHNAMQSMEKDEDEGIPSETEDDKRQLETKAKEMRDMLKQKDTEIMSLLEDKVRLFREMWDGLSPGEEACRQVQPFFRSTSSQEPPRGASIMKDALQEVETLQTLVNSSLGGAMASVHEGGGAGPVCLPRRAETFGGFDSHQMHSNKSGDRDESEEAAGDLRRTESDGVLKKGGNANLLQLLRRDSEQVLHSVSNLHLLLSSLQAVVVQQDSYIEDQRQVLSERSSSCASLSRHSSRPSSLIEQEKQRSLEKHRQELTSLQRQQTAHAEERRRREKEWERREQHLSQKEELVHLQEEQIQKQQKELEEEKQELQSRKDEYQKDLERLRDAQRKLERDRDTVRRHMDKMEELRLSERTPSTTSDESLFAGSSQSLELDPLELSSSSYSSSLPRLQPQRSKTKGKGLNPFALSATNLKSSDANNQISKSFLQLGKNKNKDGKKKKKSKGGSTQAADSQYADGEIFFC
ncbi:A-kinase anchor protein 13 [Nematolebias whitei]|uniref:A-kinase anchor protein 13 n=1 Tax=Nematolebias whitei TaxID=451745 RepID=UPI00189860B5|nr:A-kinase anchor protein 13 [Nematolebias whitei]